MNYFKNIVVQMLALKIDLDMAQIEKLIEVPPNGEMGDFAFPCFELSKTLRKAPPIIALDVAHAIEKNDLIDKVINVGPYINFYVNKSLLVKNVLEDILKNGQSYGRSNIGDGKNIVIDYSSVNIAKPFHMGHLFTTMIGNSLYKILEFMGYNCIGVNHLGDWGTQFGKLIVAYKRWGNKEEIEKEPIKNLVSIYVKFHDEAEKDNSLNDEARAAFKAIEDGVPEYIELWKWFEKVSLIEFERLYDVLNVKFDSWNGESFYMDKMGGVIRELEDKGLIVESEGARVVSLDEYNMTPCLLQRSDGATLYATRDLAAIFYRKNTYNFDKVLYVVATQQNLHFRQLFKVVELMGYEWSKDLIHVAYGMLSLESGAMSTRKGTVVYASEVISESINKVSNIIEMRNPNLENKEEVARQVGIGSVIFTTLSNSKIKDIVFTWDKVLNFEGETAPYIQYTFARICSIFRKAGYEKLQNIKFENLSDEYSIEMATILARFPEVVLNAGERYEPSVISRYLIDLAQGFNRFYHNNPVLNDNNKELQDARLAVCVATKTVIESGMTLLGIQCPDRM